MDIKQAWQVIWGCYLVGLERNRVYTARSGFPAVRGKPRWRPTLIADETPQPSQALFFRRHSMQLKEKEIVLAHEPDAAWIIALWKAIHGGDPAPEAVAAGVIASMAPYLRSFGETFTAQQLEAGFETLGVKVTQIG